MTKDKHLVSRAQFGTVSFQSTRPVFEVENRLSLPGSLLAALGGLALLLLFTGIIAFALTMAVALILS